MDSSLYFLENFLSRKVDSNDRATEDGPPTPFDINQLHLIVALSPTPTTDIMPTI